MSPESDKWNNFLTDLWRKLSTYKIQRDKKKYNVADIEHWGKLDREQGIEITKKNFKSFIKKIAQYDITEHEYVKRITITESQLSELNHILSIALKFEAHKSCSKSHVLVIRGYYVKFSDFIENNGSLSQSNGCINIRTVNIFALNTVFVDKDINLAYQKIIRDINIISPKWEIINSRVINLSSPVRDSRRDYDGKDGKPGFPGYAGGNFVGIGAKFVNGKKLTIISNGGEGGAGVDGKDGPDGSNGYFVLIVDSKVPCTRNWCTKSLPIKTFREDIWEYLTYTCKEIKYTQRGGVFSSRKHDCEYHLTGEPRGTAEDGGDGGKGGKGGNPGIILIYELNGTSEISKQNEVGKNGKDGVGGVGGDYGVLGNSVDITFTEKEGWRMVRIHPSYKLGREGENGVDGANERGMVHPDMALRPKPARIFREYKYYLRENLNDRSKRYALMEFLHQLNNDKVIKAAYDWHELIKEFEDLEEQLPTFNDEVDLNDIYQLFLDRVRRYSLEPLDLFDINRKSLCYLNTAILGKMIYMDDRPDSNLIMNIDEFLDKTMREIESGRVCKGCFKSQMTAIQDDLFNSYTEIYKKDINRQIEEAGYTIERLIEPKIENVSARIDKEIKRLISEIQTLEGLAENEHRDFIEKKNELRRATELRGLFDNLEVVEQMLSFFGPIGLSVESLIGSSTSANSSVIDNQIDHRKILRNHILSFVTPIALAKSTKFENLNSLLNDIAGMIYVHRDKFKDLSAKIDDMKKRLIFINRIKFHEILTMENELRDELKRKYSELSDSTKEENSDEQATAAKAVMDNVNKAVELYAVSQDLWYRFNYNEANLNTISNAIAQKGKEYQQLKDNKRNIHDAMIWILKSWDRIIDNIWNDMFLDDVTVTRSSFNVTSWQVPSFLEDVKLNVTKISETFEDTTDDLSHCMKLLQDTMTIMINAYGKIQDHQKEQKIINFFRDMDEETTSDTYSHFVRGLQDLLRSNFVMIKRKMMSVAMKNFVFPFAQEFLSDSVILPDARLPKTDTEEILSKVTEQTESSKSKIDIYRTYLKGTGHNPYIELGQFSNGNTSTGPFFVWKNSQNREAIRTLFFAGMSVKMRANINDSPIHKDAIKFSVAEFSFNARNETIQREINNVLEGFDIKAKHLGDSHYRCDNKIYRINSPVTSISYSLAKGAYGESMNKSLTYVDLIQSKPILSPYATWEVTMIKTGEIFSSYDLQKYTDVVGLELIGHGSYIDNRKDVYSSLSIDSHYRHIEIPNKSVRQPETNGKTSNRRSIRSADAPKYHRDIIDAPIELPSSVKCMTDCFIETTTKFINSSVIGTIKNWFQNKSIEDNGEISKHTGYSCDDAIDIKGMSAHIELPSLNIDHSSNRFIDNDNHSSRMIENNLSVTQGHLLLIDTFLRKKNGTIYKIANNKTRNLLNTDHAQHLAYNAHVPNHESSKNTKSSVNP